MASQQVRLKRAYFGECENYLNDNVIVEYRYALTKYAIMAIPKYITRLAFVTEKTQLDTSKLDNFTIKISDFKYNNILNMYEIVTKKSLFSDCQKLVEIDFTFGEYTDFLRFFNRVQGNCRNDDACMVFYNRYIFIYHAEIGFSIFKRERHTTADKVVEDVLHDYEKLGKVSAISFALTPTRADELIEKFDLHCNWSINVSHEFATGMKNVYHNLATTALAITDSSV